MFSMNTWLNPGTTEGKRMPGLTKGKDLVGGFSQVLELGGP